MDVRSRLIWSLDAEEDLLAAWRYGAEEWSPAVADEHQRVIWRSCGRLLDHPELGKSRDELAVGLRSIFVEPHVVFYRLHDGNLEIVRVLHEREDVEMLFGQ